MPAISPSRLMLLLPLAALSLSACAPQGIAVGPSSVTSGPGTPAATGSPLPSAPAPSSPAAAPSTPAASAPETSSPAPEETGPEAPEPTRPAVQPSSPAPTTPAVSSPPDLAPSAPAEPISPPASTEPAGSAEAAIPTSTPAAPSTKASTPDGVTPGKNHNASAAGYVYSAAQVQNWLTGRERSTEKIVFLTFDDGPNPTTTPSILKSLKKEGVHATFYVIGSQVKGSADLLRREIREGHAINLHSYSHNYKKLYPHRIANPDRVEEEYRRSLEALRDVLGKDFNTEGWRYPGGRMSWRSTDAADAALTAHGVHWVDWNADTRDSAPRNSRPATVAAMTANATQPIRNGWNVAVVLAHDTPDKKLTAKSVPSIIKAYRNAGYKFGVIA